MGEGRRRRRVHAGRITRSVSASRRVHVGRGVDIGHVMRDVSASPRIHDASAIVRHLDFPQLFCVCSMTRTD